MTKGAGHFLTEKKAKSSVVPLTFQHGAYQQHVLAQVSPVVIMVMAGGNSTIRLFFPSDMQSYLPMLSLYRIPYVHTLLTLRGRRFWEVIVENVQKVISK